MATATPTDPNAAAFKRMLPDLIQQHKGKFALLHAGEMAGVFDSMDAAYDHAIQNFGSDRIFIGHVMDQPDVHQAPALYHGLIRARV